MKKCKSGMQNCRGIWCQTVEGGVPLYVLCQVQHQLAVTGKQAAHICVLLCGQETKIYKVSRNEALIEQIIQAERLFWECVEKWRSTSSGCQWIGSQSFTAALSWTYPAQLCWSNRRWKLANELFDQLIQEKQQIEQHQSQFHLLKHRVQALMQEHELCRISARFSDMEEEQGQYQPRHQVLTSAPTWTHSTVPTAESRQSSFQHLSRLAQSLELITQQEKPEIPCSPAWDFFMPILF